jgi:hypothetical protein
MVKPVRRSPMGLLAAPSVLMMAIRCDPTWMVIATQDGFSAMAHAGLGDGSREE